MPRFDRYIGIDYSGAESPEAQLPGIAVFMAQKNDAPQPHSPEKRRNWCRKELAEALAELLAEPVPTIIGIDHGFSLPLRIVEPRSWDQFLRDFRAAWQTHLCPVEENRAHLTDAYRKRADEDDLRVTETWTSSAKCVLALDGQGRVGKSTFSGLPWLLYLREKLPERLHFWPFDGFEPGSGKSVVAEVYPALFKRRYERQSGMNEHQRDAYSVCRWLQAMDCADHLNRYFHPPLTEDERAAARLEGWILGVA